MPNGISSSATEQAADIVRLLQPNFWVPSQHSRWTLLVTALFQAFLEEFEPPLLKKLWQEQIELPPETSPAARAVRLASGSTAFHKLCQIFARSEFIPEESRNQLIELESLPPSTIPDQALDCAQQLARIFLDLGPNVSLKKIGRGSVADVFKISAHRLQAELALKAIRTDSGPRVRAEAEILRKLANQSSEMGALIGPAFARALSEALKDASQSLLREIDFPGERQNLLEAGEFFRSSQRVIVPKVLGPELKEALFMEFVEGVPLLENSEDASTRVEIAQALLRTLILEPLFSGLEETIFHADPHAGNLQLAIEAGGAWRIILLDWSQAGRLSAPRRHAMIELCLSYFEKKEPSHDLLERLLGASYPHKPVPSIKEGNPLQRALALLEVLAVEGHEVPVDLLLFRKSLLTLEGILRQLNPKFDLWRETLTYAAWVFASETPFRLLSFPIPWLDSPSHYRSGIPTRWLITRTAEVFVRSHNFSLTPPTPLCDSLLSQAVARRSRQQMEP